jgi:fumarate hydratase class II
MENDKKDAPNNTSEQETIKKLKADHDSLYGKYTQRAEKLYKVSEIAFKSNP